MGQMKRHYLKQADREALFGEVFDDGEFRGYSMDADAVQGGMRIGDYILVDDQGGDTFTILFKPTGEMGVFKKEHFESHVAAFFGLHF